MRQKQKDKGIIDPVKYHCAISNDNTNGQKQREKGVTFLGKYHYVISNEKTNATKTEGKRHYCSGDVSLRNK